MSDTRTRSRRWLRWLVLAVLAVAAVVLLFQVVFPWFEVAYYNPTIS